MSDPTAAALQPIRYQLLYPPQVAGVDPGRLELDRAAQYCAIDPRSPTTPERYGIAKGIELELRLPLAPQP